MINIIEMAEHYGGCRYDDNKGKNLAADILYHLVADVYDGRTTPISVILDDIDRFKRRAIKHLSKYHLLQEEIDKHIDILLEEMYNDQNYG